MRLLALFFLMAGTALAGEYAVLASGARLHVDRHEADGAKVRLYYGTGFVELESAMVRSFETEEYQAPVAAPAAVLTAEASTMAMALPLTPLELADAAGTGRRRCRPLRAAAGAGAKRHGCRKRLPTGGHLPEGRHRPDAAHAGHGAGTRRGPSRSGAQRGCRA